MIFFRNLVVIGVIVVVFLLVFLFIGVIVLVEFKSKLLII